MATYETEPLMVFDALQCFAYPSANAQNSGQLNTEENIRWIMLRLTQRSFTLSESDFFLSKTNDTTFTIKNGKANIDGYYFECKTDTIIDVTSSDILTEHLINIIQNITTSANAIPLYIKFKRNVDSAGHLVTYETDTTTNTISKFKGFEIILTDVAPKAEEFYLGYINVYYKNGTICIRDVVNNPYKCTFLNTSNLFADDDDLGNTERTINNLIKMLIRDILNGGLDGDIIVYGDEVTRDGTTNIFLSRKAKDSESQPSYLRLYYNPTTMIGGMGIVNDLSILRESNIRNDIDILSFDLSSDNSNFKIFPMNINIGKKDGTSMFNGNVTIEQDLNVTGNYNSDLGNINLNKGNITVKTGTVSASKVYGAVWS
jgi:hypothetical protein